MLKTRHDDGVRCMDAVRYRTLEGNCNQTWDHNHKFLAHLGGDGDRRVLAQVGLQHVHGRARGALVAGGVLGVRGGAEQGSPVGVVPGLAVLGPAGGWKRMR